MFNRIIIIRFKNLYCSRRDLADLQGDENDRACIVSSKPKYSDQFQTQLKPRCRIPDPPHCDYQYPYRMVDGSCNNLYNPLLGKSVTPQSRILPNAYDDCKF